MSSDMPLARSREQAVEAGLQVALAAHADNLIGDLAVLEEQQSGNRVDADN